MIYDVIIIGAGPAGLFTAGNLDTGLKVLILEKKSKAGRKLLMSGNGQCNVTNGEAIKSFVNRYGDNGKRIRQILYKFNNQKLMKYFEENQVPLFVREDGKVFPESLNANDILNVLLEDCRKNKVDIEYEKEVEKVHFIEDVKGFSIETKDRKYATKNLIIASGGLSYPTTGSDGKILNLIEAMGISVVPTHPSLTPVYVKEYPFSELSGISFKDVKITAFREHKKFRTGKGDLLLTHECFSGPAIINLSRYLQTNDLIKFNYLGDSHYEEIIINLKDVIRNSDLQLNTLLKDHFGLPKRFVNAILKELEIHETKKARLLSGREMNGIVNKLIDDEYTISRLGGYNVAMATKGGVNLNEIHSNTVESLKYHNLYFVGEVLDVDGDTGGYNLQFAFSSGKNCAERINEKLYKNFKNQILK